MVLVNFIAVHNKVIPMVAKARDLSKALYGALGGQFR